MRAQRRTDSLTGFASTSFTHARLHELATTGREEGFSVVAVIMNHLDDYRLQFGHSTGERMFRDFANNLNKADLCGGYLGHLNAHKIACVFEKITPKETLEQVAKNLEDAATFDMSVDGALFQISPITAHASYPEHGLNADEVTNFALSSAMARETKIPSTNQTDLGLTQQHDPQQDRRNSDENVADERRESKRRIEARHRVLKRGKIIVNGLASVVNCVVRNISNSGAQIRVDGYFSPPTRFQLEIIETDSQPRWVEKRWQVGNDIGLKYTETPQ